MTCDFDEVSAESATPSRDYETPTASDEAERRSESILKHELDCTESQDAVPSPARDFVGLALSGGGIRSATYCLGVIQALAQHGWMSHVDYLSTVSGGGFIGTSLTWLLWQKRPGYGTEPGRFPLDTEFGIGGFSEPKVTGKGPCNLKWLRQHGNYLTPGRGHNWASFVWVILRGVVLSVLVYLGMLTLLLRGVRGLGLLSETNAHWLSYSVLHAPWLLRAAVLLLALLGGVAVLYGVATWFAAGISPERARPTRAYYSIRRSIEKAGGWVLTAAVVLFVVGSLPFVSKQLGLFLFGPKTAGVLTLVAGVLTSLRAIRRADSGPSSRRRPMLPMAVLASVAAALVIYGLLLLAYLASAPELGNKVLAAALGAVVLGFLCDLNLVSVHRFYRDRLMEAFMPDPNLDSRAATNAEMAPLKRFRSQRPYHLLNTNVVLPSSKVPRVRARGGDSFILSPRRCGSGATGWIETEKFLDGNLTLATAMAISGAAAHPNTGVGGEGPTRSRLVSFLMAFFNVRLGVWVGNPGKQLWSGRLPPNFFYPGLFSLFPSPWLNENFRWVQLSDGGHFENLGVYELIRRRCKVIIVCDAGEDPQFRFGDLGTAVERVRVDFGVLIELFGDDLGKVKPGDGQGPASRSGGYLKEPAKRGFLVARIRYPAGDKAAPGVSSDGVLIYLKPTVLPGLTADICAYSVAHASFPGQSTLDQFFDEKQFEAYRELGFKTTYRMLEGFRQGDKSTLTDNEPELVERALRVLAANAKELKQPLWSKPAAQSTTSVTSPS